MATTKKATTKKATKKKADAPLLVDAAPIRSILVQMRDLEQKIQAVLDSEKPWEGQTAVDAGALDDLRQAHHLLHIDMGAVAPKL